MGDAEALLSLPARFEETRTIRQTDIDTFAETMGSHGRIHVDVEWATRHHGGTVAHGLLVFAPATQFAARCFGRQWARAGTMKLRFVRPVRAGETVTTTCVLMPGGAGTKGRAAYQVSCRATDGVLVIEGEIRVSGLP